VRRRSHWGWGYEDERPSLEEVRAGAAGLVDHLGFGSTDVEEPVALAALRLPAPRLEPPADLSGICSTAVHDRASHAYGKSYVDLIRAFRGRFDHPPDVIAYPRDEADVERVLAWCADAGASLTPYGGGTSVVGGVEPRGDGPAVTLDLRALDSLLDVDGASRSARIQAGANGPRLEAQLGEHGLTLRHFPQSFELSTLGGWIATRAAGHFATLYTHIDDLVESVRALTPSGVWASRRLPGSGAGPSPDRLLLGSEGTLGVITEAWVRVQAKPVHRASVTVRFASFQQGADAVRTISQAGLYPANCRLIDRREARMMLVDDGSADLLVLGFESADHELGAWLERALELCGASGGRWDEPRRSGRAGAAGAWRQAFLRAPYLRDTMVAAGIFQETFETAITWDRFPAFNERVMGVATEAVRRASGGQGQVTVRFTHVYPDGPAPYYTMVAPARRGSELEQFAEVKAAASDAVLAAGGTITHHHAVGRDHRPWYDRQRPEPFAAALRAAKAAVDPAGMLNPGVLV
jgi:alkyldihydroxyacetonephosphate synthase